MKTREVNILELGKGAIMEQIDLESQKVMANIIDPNTDARTARKLTITLTLKPDENRDVVSCTAQAKATLAPIKPIVASIYVDTDKDGKPIATELTKENPNQLSVFDEDQEVKVIKLRSVNQ